MAAETKLPEKVHTQNCACVTRGSYAIDDAGAEYQRAGYIDPVCRKVRAAIREAIEGARRTTFNDAADEIEPSGSGPSDLHNAATRLRRYAKQRDAEELE